MARRLCLTTPTSRLASPRLPPPHLPTHSPPPSLHLTQVVQQLTVGLCRVAHASSSRVARGPPPGNVKHLLERLWRRGVTTAVSCTCSEHEQARLFIPTVHHKPFLLRTPLTHSCHLGHDDVESKPGNPRPVPLTLPSRSTSDMTMSWCSRLRAMSAPMTSYFLISLANRASWPCGSKALSVAGISIHMGTLALCLLILLENRTSWPPGNVVGEECG